MLYVILRFFKKPRTDCFHLFFFKCIIYSEALTVTLLSSRCWPSCFGGLPLLAVILVFYSHHWQINLIMCRAKKIIVSLEKASEIQGSSPEMGAKP